MNRRILVVTLLAIILCWSLSAQEKKQPKPDEIKGEVPALENFHDVIYKIWHTAWPEKDVKMLAELNPEVQEAGSALVKAELPGILREKKNAWKEQITKLEAVMNAYKASSAPIDSLKLLDAAEQLHGSFEKLVRVIRPALDEMEAFHAVLYPIYHYYLPEKNNEKLASSVKELKTTMAALDKATLPERLKAKQPAFSAARKKLSKSVDAVVKAQKSGDAKKVASSIETMHSDYQALEKIFE